MHYEEDAPVEPATHEQLFGELTAAEAEEMINALRLLKESPARKYPMTKKMHAKLMKLLGEQHALHQRRAP